mmetsp:Transcript_19452/g.28095  ORF Transcript_19452/g.28095 Transcript_19452/m.28095 type:complete len:227 (-) Transcript_19452:993-1673(-)
MDRNQGDSPSITSIVGSAESQEVAAEKNEQPDEGGTSRTGEQTGNEHGKDDTRDDGKCAKEPEYAELGRCEKEIDHDSHKGGSDDVNEEEGDEPTMVDICFSDRHHLHKFLETEALFECDGTNHGGERIQQTDSNNEGHELLNSIIKPILHERGRGEGKERDTVLCDVVPGIFGARDGEDPIVDEPLDGQDAVVSVLGRAAVEGDANQDGFLISLAGAVLPSEIVE